MITLTLGGWAIFGGGVVVGVIVGMLAMAAMAAWGLFHL